MRFEDFVGNGRAKKRIKILLDYSIKYSTPVPNMAFFGPSGMGKTTLSRLCANYLGRELVHIDCAGVPSAAIFKTILEEAKYGNGTVILLDECHRLPKVVQDSLLTALEYPSVLTTVEGDRLIRTKIPNNASFILATTHSGAMSDALLSRLEVIHIEGYNLEEKGIIAAKYLLRKWPHLKGKIEPASVMDIARRSRSGRDVVKNCDRAYKWMAITNSFMMNKVTTEHVFNLHAIDKNGLTAQDREILAYLDKTGRASLETLEAVLSKSAKEIKDKIEPWLIKEGLIVRRSGGRLITERGRQALRGIKIKE